MQMHCRPAYGVITINFLEPTLLVYTGHEVKEEKSIEIIIL